MTEYFYQFVPSILYYILHDLQKWKCIHMLEIWTEIENVEESM